MERKAFNRYKLNEAFELVGIQQLLEWKISMQPLTPSAVFHTNVKRLEAFDTLYSESGKEVLIDAILSEALSRRNRLKIWKEATLKTDIGNGRVEYLISERLVYLKRPFLCISEAKKDDFEKGLAQCLVEMKACQILNAKAGYNIDVHGIVTNGTEWHFYKLTPANQVYAGGPYTFPTYTNDLLGVLDAVFAMCEANLG